MLRISAMFIAVCMVLIAGSLGAGLYLGAGVNGLASIFVTVAALLAMALYKIITHRGDSRDDTERTTALSRATIELGRRIDELGRRLDAVESRAVASTEGEPQIVMDPLAVELDELGILVNQLAQTVAAHETELNNRAEAMAAFPAPPVAAPRLENPAVAQEVVDTPVVNGNESGIAESSVAEPAGHFRGMSRESIVSMIGDAVDTNRIDLYLQPIVTLPQRKVRYYEALSRLRTADGEIVPAAEFIDYVESSGAMSKIDNLLVFRCVQVLRRLQLKNRDVGLFCNIDTTTLSDSTYFQQFLEFMEANRALAPTLMLEFTQHAYRNFGPIEHESLAALADRGFRFSMDHVTDLRITPKELAERSFRVVKVPAKLLLDRAAGAQSDIHPADLADLLARSGIDLIAERIETEAMVVDLLDQDVRFGQGFLFSQPRPIRAETLQRASDAAPAPPATVAVPMPRPRTAFVMRGEKVAAR
ncbi:MAG TPA: EAL domain-containing protein [Pseudolabrys sp.]|nr:EAL domain-containing protein [Pseudolabrys sp.]